MIIRNKQLLRKQLIEKRSRLSTIQIQKKSRHIHALLSSIDAFQKAQCLGLYVSFDQEVNTHQMIQDCLERNKRVVVPKCSDDGTMVLCEINSFNELIPGFKDILEPCSPLKQINLPDIDVLIIPGVGFDHKGHRLGRGSGYYDRLLIGKKLPLTIGLAFDLQVIPKIPIKNHDVSIDIIVTENKVIQCKKYI